jgi:hypothetical protein
VRWHDRFMACRVLLVDDNSDFRSAARQLLERHGAVIAEADTGSPNDTGFPSTGCNVKVTFTGSASGTAMAKVTLTAKDEIGKLHSPPLVTIVNASSGGNSVGKVVSPRSTGMIDDL